MISDSEFETNLPKPGNVIADRYQLEEMIGKGGMGVVFRAKHLEMGQPVAIKFLNKVTNDNTSRRFLQEARILFALKSQHVTRVLDFGRTEDGHLYSIMEYLPGKNLELLFLEQGRLSQSMACYLISDACRGMMEAHALGIVHRDLKPSNLMLTSLADGTPLVKVLDLGIAKLLKKDVMGITNTTLTASGIILGSVKYVSPEQLQGELADERSDIWSLGVILYEFLAGVHPFVAESHNDTLSRILEAHPKPLQEIRPDVTNEVCSIVHRCMERKRNRRYPTARELLEALLPFSVAPTRGSENKFSDLTTQFQLDGTIDPSQMILEETSASLPEPIIATQLSLEAQPEIAPTTPAAIHTGGNVSRILGFLFFVILGGAFAWILLSNRAQESVPLQPNEKVIQPVVLPSTTVTAESTTTFSINSVESKSDSATMQPHKATPFVPSQQAKQHSRTSTDTSTSPTFTKSTTTPTEDDPIFMRK